jgi:excisionase family DNA binding protein
MNTKHFVEAGVGNQWLTLKEASEFLGVHFTTLRGWADRGEIPVFRTPGGHRRFGHNDLRRFLAERAQTLPAANGNALVEAAVDRARAELQRVEPDAQRWHASTGDAIDQVRRERGRTLFALAISFVMKPQQRGSLLESGRELGKQYGVEAAHSGITLVETGRAVQFFRRQLLDTVRSGQTAHPDVDDIRVEQLLDHFLDEVLYAVLDGYEAQLNPDRALGLDGAEETKPARQAHL